MDDIVSTLELIAQALPNTNVVASFSGAGREFCVQVNQHSRLTSVQTDGIIPIVSFLSVGPGCSQPVSWSHSKKSWQP